MYVNLLCGHTCSVYWLQSTDDNGERWKAKNFFRCFCTCYSLLMWRSKMWQKRKLAVIFFFCDEKTAKALSTRFFVCSALLLCLYIWAGMLEVHFLEDTRWVRSVGVCFCAGCFTENVSETPRSEREMEKRAYFWQLALRAADWNNKQFFSPSSSLTTLLLKKS